MITCWHSSPFPSLYIPEELLWYYFCTFTSCQNFSLIWIICFSKISTIFLTPVKLALKYGCITLPALDNKIQLARPQLGSGLTKPKQ